MSYRRSNRSTQNIKPEWKNIKILFKEESYVAEAEEVIKEMKKHNFSVGRGPDNSLTTSQLRNLLKLTSTLYDEVQSRNIEEVMDRLAYLRIQFVYQSGRNGAVKKMVELAQILDILEMIQVNKNKAEFIRFCHYMEALIAYFKFYGGKD